MSAPLRVWLVRHGESAANAGLPSRTHDSVALTERGQAQAQAVAQRVAEPPALLVVSPYLRAQQTAAPIATRWPDTPRDTWPIQEFSYLDPERCRDTTSEMRRPWAAAYWARSDPHYIDGPGAESFAQFMQRLMNFRTRLLERARQGGGLVVAVGHGQFFRACLWGEPRGYEASAAAMVNWRAAEMAHPMANGEIIDWPLNSAPARNT